MNPLPKVLDFLNALADAFTEWPSNLRQIAARICALARLLCERMKLPDRLDRSGPQRCVKISDPAYKRPDPLIYAQYYLMGQGLAVTWDNPDIDIRSGGNPVAPHMLAPDTEYEIVARIWNNSTEAPVVDLPVKFSYLSFGIGTVSHWIDETRTDLGVKGGANHPAFASVKWRTPAAPGHYCIQVLLDWLDDANPNNNLGQDNTTVGVAHSPARFEFRLRNGERERMGFRLEADAYSLPELPVCEPRPRPRPRRRPLRTFPGTIAAVPVGHTRQSHPLPAGWLVTFEPAQADLAPGEEIPVTVNIEPPAGFTGRKAINVHAFSARGLAGGVTLYVER
ncbi:hypothetical protein [Mesorhizobium sp. ORM16]|uniref:COG1470 family protein n=1 Tax=Mesorhizobium sp. ORM16 TaxID=3376989 RepID=UPI003857670E